VASGPDLMREFWQAATRAGETGNTDEWASFLSDDVTWEAMEDAPDAGTYHGHDGLRAYFEDWLGSVDDLRFEVGEVSEVGDFVVTDQRMVATVKGTDAQMELHYAVAVRVADGKVVQGKEFREREEAVAYARGNSAQS
jgi:ketosteroid isomerase-like protein